MTSGQKRAATKRKRAKKQGVGGKPTIVKGVAVLKERKSKEAFEKKKQYDTKYHSTPERKEYRRKLAVVRRKRGVMGKGGNDMSHAKNGKIVSEKPSANRARHFKGKGTLK